MSLLNNKNSDHDKSYTSIETLEGSKLYKNTTLLKDFNTSKPLSFSKIISTSFNPLILMFLIRLLTFEIIYSQAVPCSYEGYCIITRDLTPEIGVNEIVAVDVVTIKVYDGLIEKYSQIFSINKCYDYNSGASAIQSPICLSF